MAILTRDEARDIMQKVINLSKADHCEVNLQGSIGRVTFVMREIP
ncbi:MAG: hypothetical protein U5K71_10720 [Gracilimonas sp.]|nr:hypothetical protein [Gracilimonas sp.]